jgi:hypothetical protein
MSLHMRPIRLKLGPLSINLSKRGLSARRQGRPHLHQQPHPPATHHWAVQHLVAVEADALRMALTQLSRYQEIAWNT